MNLQNLFNPKSVAVIGASNDKSKVGYALMANLLSGAKREIYPVTISEKEVLGQRAYPSVKNIMPEIDLALIAVRAEVVPMIVEECAAKGIKTVIIIAAGFKELGPAGAALEKRCAEIAQKNGITLLGPNCLGTIDTKTGLNASFASDNPKSGRIAFVSQSGALGTALLDKSLAEGVGFSKFISLGNEAALTELEFMEFLRDDPDTGAVLMYVEQLADGARFMKLAAEIAQRKPIALIKAGRNARGLQAVQSHTGSLAPEDAVFTAACRQSGVIVADSVREFFNLAKLFELGVTKPLQRLIVLTNAGGPGVVTADLIGLTKSLSLIDLSDGVKNALKQVLPPMAAFGNPVDIIGDALAARYEAALKILVEVGEADAIVTLLTPQMMTETEATAKLLATYRAKKPILPVFIGGPIAEKGVAELKKAGMVNFAFPKDAVEALDGMAQGASKREIPSVARPGAAKSDLRMMSCYDMQELFQKNNLKLTCVLVQEKKDLLAAMKAVGKDPYTLKAMSPDIVHKTEIGAVKLDLKTVTEMQTAWDEIKASINKKAPSANLEGMLVQTMMPGKETIVGMKRDPIFGPTILFGLGGIFTEALKDTSMRIAPVTKEMALAMIHEIRGVGILLGLRGEKSVDMEALADIVVKISALAMSHPEIKEIDLNPVMASPEGAEIVDARVMV